jgi:outer membrane biosynthesis protein TonB
MPIFEVPTQPSSSPPEPPRPNRRTRYEDLEPHEVFHLIEQLEDERARSRFRESVWISLIINMIVMWFLFYGPRYIFHQVHVVNPADVIRQRQDELRYLDLPPDALKHIKPKQPAPMSDKDRVAQSRKPTLDKKTLQQLEAMKRAGPPVPQPAPEQQPQQPSPAPQQQAPQQQAQAAPPKPSQPIPQNQQSQLEAPPPAPTAPNFQQGPSSPGQAIRDAARAAARGGPQFGGDSGANAPSEHSGMNGGVDILSDTMGVDFGPYMKRIIYDTERAWWPIIPQVAQPPLSKQGRTGIRFKIYPDGSVKEMILELPSGDVSLDRAAWGGITGASPYPSLPKQFKGPYLELRFWFLYNLSPQQIR